jgi:hypothetical protein
MWRRQGGAPDEPEEGFVSIALRQRLGEPTRTLANARGTMRIWARPERRLVVTSAHGHGAVEFVAPFLEVLDDAVAKGATSIWDDWARVTSYDSETRVRIMAWTRAHDWIARDIHVLVGSKLIAMGLAVSNLALGGALQVTTDRAAFEREIFARLGGR